MELPSADKDTRLAVFQELISCGQTIFTWRYDADGRLLETNCPDPVPDTIFTHIGCKSYMLHYGQTHTAPLILGAELGMIWCAAFDREGGALRNMYVLGPVFNSETSLHGIEDALRQFRIDEVKFTIRLVDMLRQIPTVAATLFFQYGLMLHYCVTGEKLQRSDIQCQVGEAGGKTQRLHQKDRLKTYAAEQALLRMVREGDLNYQEAYNRAGDTSSGVQVHSEKPLGQALISGTVFTSLCVRAAIEGGLSPESAYALGDSYIQSMVDSRTLSELAVHIHEMYQDFVERVHKARTNPKLSPQVQSCCDYIEFHLEEPLPLPMLARRVGYTEYYLSRKFKKEMGVNISDYIRFARVERAKLLLSTTDMPVAQIAERLQFCSGSYFADVFRSVTGMLPQAWRESRKTL